MVIQGPDLNPPRLRLASAGAAVVPSVVLNAEPM